MSPFPEATGGCLLLATSNGAGLGHVTRLMAVARRLPEQITLTFATQSLSAPLVADEGFAVEYVMGAHQFGGGSRAAWYEYLEHRFRHLLEVYEPDAFVFDGVAPYPGMMRAFEGHPATCVWLRRGMWRHGHGGGWPAQSSRFDLVVEPLDAASESDYGAPAADLGRTAFVPPITFLDEDELLDRAAARRELGIPPDQLAALVTLGAGNLNDTRSTRDIVLDCLRDAQVEPYLAVSPLAIDPPAADVRTLSLYPLSRYLKAFDFAVGAPGYNTTHEFLLADLPSILVPNRDAATDDQALRAEVLTRRRLALVAEDEASIRAGVELLADLGLGAEIARRLSRTSWDNGAHELARIVASLVGTGTGQHRG